MSLTTTLRNLHRYTFGGTQHSATASATGDLEQKVNYILANPPAVLAHLGLGKAFPFTNGSVTDLVINGSDQTVAPTNGVLRYRTITFSTVHTLRITQARCILMVDTLVWNAAGVIACEASGAPALGADPAESFPRGGRALSTGDAIGGYGGGFLIVLAGTVNGSTTGTIRANGTAASSNNTNAGSNTYTGGEGAASASLNWAGRTPRSVMTVEAWHGVTGATLPGAPGGPGAMFLSPGGSSSLAGASEGTGGGSGTGSTAGGGGSGFGGGGAFGQTGAPVAPVARLVDPSLPDLLTLWAMGVRGGGAGGSGVHTTGTNNAAGGGGGGCVVLFVDTETQVSTLTAAGGAKSGNAAWATDGGAGYTLRQIV